MSSSASAGSTPLGLASIVRTALRSSAPAGLRLLKEGPFGALAPPKALDFDGTRTTRCKTDCNFMPVGGT